MQAPGYADVVAAREFISPYLLKTPLVRIRKISEALGCDYYVKLENLQPVGAFKVRGGVNLMSSLGEEERRRGVITASTGNHGQSIAFAARLFGVKAYICVPHAANPGKVAAIRGMGAEIVEHGERFEDAVREARRLARDKGYRFIHSANEPLLIAGVATEALEMLEDQPDIDTIFVPVGLGSGASGTCIAAKAINRGIRVIAAQADASPAVHDSWRSGRIEVRSNETFAEGLATGEAAEMTLEIMSRHLDDFHLMSEDEIRQGMVWWIERCHTLAESAAGAVLSAAYRSRASLKDRKVGLICSGGNTSLSHLKEALNRHRG